MRSFLQLVIKEGSIPPSSIPESGENAWKTRPVYDRLVALLIAEAVSSFQHDPVVGSPESSCVRAPCPLQAGKRKEEQVRYQQSALWAIRMLQTVVMLENKHYGMGWPALKGSEGPSISKRALSEDQEDDDADGDASPVALATTSARSPRTFAAVLRASNDDRLDEKVQASAYDLCSHILNVSRFAPPSVSLSTPEGARIAGPSDEDSRAECHSLNGFQACMSEKDIFPFLPEGVRLARAFSARLRGEISTQSLASPLLQSQLELLAQWQLRGSTTGSGRGTLADRSPCTPAERQRVSAQVKAHLDSDAVPHDIWNCPMDERSDIWDVATQNFAGLDNELGKHGANGEDDGGQTTQAKALRARRLSRPGTTESEGSTLSNLHPSSTQRGLCIGRNDSLVVETASANSVTLSWGNWPDTGQSPELQVDIGGDGIAYPVALGNASNAFHKTRTLRCKLKHVADRRRQQGPSLVLKVSSSNTTKTEVLYNLNTMAIAH